MNTLRNRMIEQYAPLAEQFVEEIEGLNVKGIPAPHIPIMGQNYERAKYRIAFIGMETLGWSDIEEFCEFVKSDSSRAVVLNEGRINSLEYLSWPRNYTSTFWGFVLKFISKFYQVDFLDLIVNNTNPELLTSFVWGNSNSIERYGVNSEPNGVDYNVWEKVKQASVRFDSLNNLTKSLLPKLIFILNRNVENDYIMSDEMVRSFSVPIEKKKSVLTLDVNEEMKIRYHYLRDDNVHIIALPHPTWMGVYSGKSINEYVEEVIKIIERFQIWESIPQNSSDWEGVLVAYDKSSIEYKRAFLADLAKTLMRNNLLMSGKDLQLIFNMNGILTQSGCSYSTNGGKGIHHLISKVWEYYYYEVKDYQTAYNISRVFVNQNGEYAW